MQADATCIINQLLYKDGYYMPAVINRQNSYQFRLSIFLLTAEYITEGRCNMKLIVLATIITVCMAVPADWDQFTGKNPDLVLKLHSC